MLLSGSRKPVPDFGSGSNALSDLTSLLSHPLESLDQPSQVTLVECGRYVRQGLQYGLAEWRENGWRWEFFGDMVPVKNGDLWQRLDRALRFHQVECCRRRFDPPHETPREPAARLCPKAPATVLVASTAVRAEENRGENVESGIRVADHD